MQHRRRLGHRCSRCATRISYLRSSGRWRPEHQGGLSSIPGERLSHDSRIRRRENANVHLEKRRIRATVGFLERPELTGPMWSPHCRCALWPLSPSESRMLYRANVGTLGLHTTEMDPSRLRHGSVHAPKSVALLTMQLQTAGPATISILLTSARTAEYPNKTDKDAPLHFYSPGTKSQ